MSHGSNPIIKMSSQNISQSKDKREIIGNRVILGLIFPHSSSHLIIITRQIGICFFSFMGVEVKQATYVLFYQVRFLFTLGTRMVLS